MRAILGSGSDHPGVAAQSGIVWGRRYAVSASAATRARRSSSAAASGTAHARYQTARYGVVASTRHAARPWRGTPRQRPARSTRAPRRATASASPTAAASGSPSCSSRDGQRVARLGASRSPRAARAPAASRGHRRQVATPPGDGRSARPPPVPVGARATARRRGQRPRGTGRAPTSPRWRAPTRPPASAARCRTASATASAGERADQRVVVPAARELDREHRVPARRAPPRTPVVRPCGRRRGRDEHGGRGERLEEPGRRIGRGPATRATGSESEREHRAVDRRRVAPVRADVVGSPGSAGKPPADRRTGCRRPRLRSSRTPSTSTRRSRGAAGAASGTSWIAAAEPEHEPHGGASANRGEADEVRHERADEKDEERPGGPGGRVRAVGRDDGRAAPPRERGCERRRDRASPRRSARRRAAPVATRRLSLAARARPVPGRSRGCVLGLLLVLVRRRGGRRVVRVVAQRMSGRAPRC